jgi:hypothetical protein
VQLTSQLSKEPFDNIVSEQTGSRFTVLVTIIARGGYGFIGIIGYIQFQFVLDQCLG